MIQINAEHLEDRLIRDELGRVIASVDTQPSGSVSATDIIYEESSIGAILQKSADTALAYSELIESDRLNRSVCLFGVDDSVRLSRLFQESEIGTG